MLTNYFLAFASKYREPLGKGKLTALDLAIKKFLSTLLVLSIFPISANASTLINNTSYLDYELPKTIQDKCYERNNCPEIEVKYLKSNHEWLNKIVNARINNIVINSKPSESPVSKATTDIAAKAALDDFAKSQFIEMPNNAPWAYSLTVTPEYLGHVQLGSTESTRTEDLELLEINLYVFTGGAHGMPFSEYLLFDPASKKQLKLDDMLQAGKKSRFKALAYESYKAWVKTMDEDVKSYEQNWPFSLSEDIILTDKGVEIRYQPYAIGPYAHGMPVLNIAYSKLDGVFKPHYLPK